MGGDVLTINAAGLHQVMMSTGFVSLQEALLLLGDWCISILMLVVVEFEDFDPS